MALPAQSKNLALFSSRKYAIAFMAHGSKFIAMCYTESALYIPFLPHWAISPPLSLSFGNKRVIKTGLELEPVLGSLNRFEPGGKILLCLDKPVTWLENAINFTA